jgi:hypothetical protein
MCMKPLSWNIVRAMDSDVSGLPECKLFPEDGDSRFLRNVRIYQTTKRHIPEDSNRYKIRLTLLLGMHGYY